MLTLQSHTQLHFSHPTWFDRQNFAIQSIIQPIAKSILASELKIAERIHSRKGLDLYLVTASDAPYIMQELGRIREIEFRRQGGGTGNAVDIDRFDTGVFLYQQLIVWDSQEQEIVSAYRCMVGETIAHLNIEHLLATGELFHFSNQFQHEYLPYTIELGRLVVNQSAKQRRLGLFVLWCGLAALMHQYPKLRYFFGKVTIFPSYHSTALQFLLQFLQLYYPDPDRLVYPKPGLEILCADSSSKLTPFFSGANHDRDYQQLRQQLSALGESFPLTLRPYLKLTPHTRHFGAAFNAAFGQTIEIGILVPINQIPSTTLKPFTRLWR